MKISLKSSFVGVALILSSQVTVASEFTDKVSTVFSYVSSYCKKMFPCLKKRKVKEDDKKRPLVAEKTKTLRSITMEEFTSHDNQKEPWLLVDGIIYDVSGFVNEHPGGALYIENLYGIDATDDFCDVHTLDKFKEEPSVKAVARITNS